MKKKGCVQVYTGNGKGKTTAAVGLAVRAFGHGWKVGFFQFFKKPVSGEIGVLRRLGVFCLVGCPCHRAMQKHVAAEDISRGFSRAWKRSSLLARTGGFDLVVLDEILVALRDGLLSRKELRAFLDSLPPATEVVLTGRCPRRNFTYADLVTEMKPVRHPWPGVGARRGIEF